MSSQSTETRGAWLWRKMATIYGARFLDLWQAVDPADVQAEWSHALQGMSREALMRGIRKLYVTRYAPTLPEFIELCAPPPPMYRQPTLALTDERRTPPGEAREQLAQLREIADTVTREAPATAAAGGGLAWAYRILQRAAEGEPITPRQIYVAREAIEAAHGIHGPRPVWLGATL
jgi:hypothetical protein